MNKILLIGSTGMIGSRITEEARKRSHEVTEATRSGGDNRLALDATDATALAAAAKGHDVIVSAISPPRDGSDPTQPLLAAGRSIIDAARQSGVNRVVVVGGAGSLLLEDGSQVVDQPWFPEVVKPEALAQSELLDVIRNEATGLDWTYVSPPAQIEPGERTGTYTTGRDNLVADEAGTSAVSAEDFAVAIVDEIENNAFVGQRFTLAYT